MSFAYYTPKGCRFRGIPLSFSSIGPRSHELSPGLGAGVSPKHERIISPTQFCDFFRQRALISALPAPPARGVHFGGALVTFEQAQGRWGAVPVTVESPDGVRSLILDALPVSTLEGLEAEEVVVSRLALSVRGALGLQSVVDQLVCLRRAREHTESTKFRIGVGRLDIAWALVEGLRARGEEATLSGSWSRLVEDTLVDDGFHLSPIDGHLRRLKVYAFVSSVTDTLSKDLLKDRPHYLVRDTGTLDQFRELLDRMHHPRVVGPPHLLAALEKAGMTLSTTVTQASFGW